MTNQAHTRAWRTDGFWIAGFRGLSARKLAFVFEISFLAKHDSVVASEGHNATEAARAVRSICSGRGWTRSPTCSMAWYDSPARSIGTLSTARSPRFKYKEGLRSQRSLPSGCYCSRHLRAVRRRPMRELGPDCTFSCSWASTYHTDALHSAPTNDVQVRTMAFSYRTSFTTRLVGD